MNDGVDVGYGNDNREVMQLEALLAEKTARLVQARETVEHLETIVHRAALIAGHLPYLCESLPEPSLELLQAAEQLEQLLVKRNV